MSRKSASLNRVLVMKNNDNTVTVTFLGGMILKKVPTPIDKDVATRAIKSVMDDEERVELCQKRGIIEQLANEAVKNGAAEAFQDDLLPFIEQGFKRLQRPKKSEVQSPATPKYPKKKKRVEPTTTTTTTTTDEETDKVADDEDEVPLKIKKTAKRAKKTKVVEENVETRENEAADPTPSNGETSDDKADAEKEQEVQTQAE